MGLKVLNAAQTAPGGLNGALGEGLGQAFEHSITWEDDVWQADPVDVDVVHAKARRKFFDLLAQLTADKPSGKPGLLGRVRAPEIGRASCRERVCVPV